MKKRTNTIISELSRIIELKEKIFAGNFDKFRITISPFVGSSKTLFINEILEFEKKIFILLPSVHEVNEVNAELNALELAKHSIMIERFETEYLQEKITELSKKEKFILLSTYDILSVRLPSKDEINKNTTIIETGESTGYDELIEYLNLLEYSEDKYVGYPGDFAVRGSIIDFWSFSEKQPARVEFDGDFIESIRYFNSENQRSSNNVERVTLASSISNNGAEYNSTIFEYLDNPLIFASEYELKTHFEAEDVGAENVEVSQDEIEKDITVEITNDTDSAPPEEPLNENKILFEYEELFCNNRHWIIEQELGGDGRFDLNLSGSPVINSSFEMLSQILSKYAKKNFQIILTAENELQAQRLYDLLSEYKRALQKFLEDKKIVIESLAIKAGFISKTDKLLVLTDYQIYNKPYRTKSLLKNKYKKSLVKDFATIKRGDFVVHEIFGIGQYAGLESIKIGQTEQESIKILYAQGGVVYVNLNYLSLVKKFSSKENAAPTLSTLGSGKWKRTKKNVKSKIKEAARELITLYAKRKSSQGIAFSPDTIWQKELEASFFYEDTPDQAKVTDEVKADMESENPMDRLVCGDVGFGKTEIAVRAAFKAVNEGLQAALLVPTTILAEQHFQTFKDRLAPYPVKTEVLSRFVKKKKQNEILKELANGNVDILIGTHRLLSKDVEFKKLGLLIIDEEQRFGVMAKEKLRAKKVNVDTLTLTATPIPRTLNLSLLGARDLSIIATPPLNRQPIYTRVEQFDILKIREWILNEIKRNGQIYFVHDRVYSIDKLGFYLQKHIPEIKIVIAHGQMKPAELEKVLHEFMNRKFDVLLSTKIIESGIDIPNVNTIIVNRSDRFGLAELHQLRGRVGRSNRQAFAYFIVPSLNTITKKAVKRLQAIEEYTDIGEGFNLSMRDLEIRGAGNLLGTEQSGTIDTVGFDLYIKLLDEAVSELKHDEFSEIFKNLPAQLDRTKPSIDAFFEVGIPKRFMPDQADRLGYYTALFSIVKIEEIKEIKEELKDKFGNLPESVERLIKSAELRFYASFAMFEKIIIQKERLILVFPKQEKADFYENKFTGILQWILSDYSKELYFKQTEKVMKLERNHKFRTVDEILDYLINFCKKTARQIENNMGVFQEL